MIRNILVPTDFSEGSAAALEHARELAAAFGASLHLMHVVQNPFATGAYMEMYAPLGPEYFERLEADARARLEDCLSAQDKDRYRAVLATRSGVPAEQILERLREKPAIDLVVMATHGRGGVPRLVMGSVAERVLRAAPCPVMTVRERPRAASTRVA